MKLPSAILLALVLLAGCNKSKDKRETKAVTEEPATETAEPVCDDSIEAHFLDCKKALLAYTELKMPGQESDCETLRLFIVDLAPLSQELYKKITKLKAFSKSQPEACRERNKDKYGAEMGALMNELAKSMGPEMDRLEKRVRSCKDHPGMAEAFQAASFPATP